MTRPRSARISFSRVSLLTRLLLISVPASADHVRSRWRASRNEVTPVVTGGIVTDPQGAPLVRARVRLINSAGARGRFDRH